MKPVFLNAFYCFFFLSLYNNKQVQNQSPQISSGFTNFVGGTDSVIFHGCHGVGRALVLRVILPSLWVKMMSLNLKHKWVQ